jgi:hypothetical protein
MDVEQGAADAVEEEDPDEFRRSFTGWMSLILVILSLLILSCAMTGIVLSFKIKKCTCKGQPLRNFLIGTVCLSTYSAILLDFHR